MTHVQRRPRREWPLVILLLLTMLCASCSEDLPSAADNVCAEKGSTSAPVSTDEFQCVAYWRNMLLRHPDLPDKVEAIVAERERTQTHEGEKESGKVELAVLSREGNVTAKADTIDVIVTDLDTASLKHLLSMWTRIPKRAQELNIEAKTSSGSGSEHNVVVLGSDAKVKVKGPSGFDRQEVRILATDLVGVTRLTVFAFGTKGEQTARTMPFDYVATGQSGRGPPGRGTSERGPPRSKVTVVVAGSLSEVSIGGAEGNSEQLIAFERFVESGKRSTYVEPAVVGAAAAAVAGHAAAHRAQAASKSGSRSRGGSYRSRGPRVRVRR